MIVFSQDGMMFVYLEKQPYFQIEEYMDEGRFAIFAGKVELGVVDTLQDAKKVLMNIADAFVTAAASCDPW